MVDWSTRNGYVILLVLIYIVYPSVTSANKRFKRNILRSKEKVCGPLPKYISETDRCIVNGDDNTCPMGTETDGTVRKYCSPFYSSNSTNYATYTCKNGNWTTRSFCQAECGRKRTYAMPLIVGGQEVAKYEFPWVAAIYTGTTTLCSGNIVSPYHVLTVAHCFTKKNGRPKRKDKFIIKVGKHYREPLPDESSAQERSIKNFIIHEQYRGGDGSFDIALMEVGEAFIFTAEVQPICIDWNSTYENSVFVEGNEGIVTGWGYIEKNGPRSEILRKVEVGLRNRTTCLDQLPSDFRELYLTDDKFCAGYINASKSVCIGDAGAGLVFLSGNRYYLRGIAAVMMMTPEGCETNHYALYTKVSYYLMWLMRNMMIKDNIFMEFRTRINTQQNELGCALPEHVLFGKFLHLDDRNYEVNQVVPDGSTIKLKCDIENSEEQLFYCIDKQWQYFDRAKCNDIGYQSITFENKESNRSDYDNKNDVSCGPLPKHISEIDRCIINGEDNDCPVRTETDAIVGKYCSPHYSRNSRNYTIYTCKNGNWTSRNLCQAECGKKRTYAMPLIVGGQEVAKYEFPWVAAIYTGATTLCSGNIVSPYHVLTVAHCFTKKNGRPQSKDKFIIRVGKHYRKPLPNEPSAQERNIKNLIIHEQYRGGNNSFDIALMEVNQAFIFTAQVQPICIDWNSVHEDSVFVEGNVGIVTGWGYIQERGPRSEVLRKVDVGLWTRSKCFNELPSDFRELYFTDDKFCAGYINASKNVCIGDAGAGLVFLSDNRYYLRGIAATMMMTPEGCESNHYTLYTKVSYYLMWLMQNMVAKDGILMEFRTGINSQQNKIGCTLPEHVTFGKFFHLNSQNYKVGQVVSDRSIIQLKCNDENSEEQLFHCIDNRWQHFDKAKCNAPGQALVSARNV
ncbi:hypothetical protein Trydic_g16723 [Trypoxylus dichotomus]